jgi:uncharacterized protein
MKASRYNLLVDTEPSGTKLLFNGGSAALVELDADSVPTVTRLLREPSSASTPQEAEYVAHLTRGRFLVPNDVDEIEQLHVKNRSGRVANSTLFLTIAPTLACNFACEYCFESQSSLRMSAEIEQAVIELATGRLADSEAMLVTWFGGEPTLCLDTIERLQRTFLERAAAADVTMEAGAIITNGYRLDRATAGRLAAVGVMEAQVTLDGPPQVHDRRRPLRSGGGTFDRIVANLGEASESMRIAVRVNVDQTNVTAAARVVERLERDGLLDRIHFYFAPVNAAEGVCADMKDRCFTTPAFAARQVEIYQTLLDKGFRGIEYPALATGAYCGADSENSFVIGPNGLLFRCWEELSLDDHRSVGSVLDPALEPHQQANLDRYRAWDPFEKRLCPGCDILPICMGGCPHQGIELSSPDHGSCCSWKHNLKEMLLLRHLCERRKEVTP